MKRFFKSILICVTAIALAGCAFFKDAFSNIDENQMALITSSVTVATSAGVKAACKSGGENAVIAFKATSEAITLAINANAYEPTLLKAFIKEQLGEGNAYYPVVESALTVVVNTYQVFYNANWKDSIESQTVMCQFFTAIKAGIDLGVSNVPTGTYQQLAGMGEVKPLQEYTAADLTVIK